MSPSDNDSERKWWQGSVEFERSKREQSQTGNPEMRDKTNQAINQSNLIVRKLSGWYRLWIVLSFLWILFFYTGMEVWEYPSHQKEFILIGVLPVIIFWGFIWVYKGFKPNKKY